MSMSVSGMSDDLSIQSDTASDLMDRKSDLSALSTPVAVRPGRRPAERAG
jgi:hypothetical protein